MKRLSSGLALVLFLHLAITDDVQGFSSLQFSIMKRRLRQRLATSSLPVVAGADISVQDIDESPQVVGDKVIYRGKVNEIDYCIAPADVSLSRAYGQQGQGGSSMTTTAPTTTAATQPKAAVKSLTQALNNASNRAVRRILLAKCWPSEEALNKSLRLAAAAEKQAQENAARKNVAGGARCPVPRPILNLLMRRGSSPEADNEGSSHPSPKISYKGGEIGGPYTTGSSPTPPSPTQLKTRTNEQYVTDQILAFRERYGTLEGYEYAEAYLESILCLATTGKESARIKDVLKCGVYDESYRRVISVLKSVGVVLEDLPGTDRFQIANKLRDQNFCLSVIDMLPMEKNILTPRGGDGIADASTSNTTETTLPTNLKNDDETSSGKKKYHFQFWKKMKVNKEYSETSGGSSVEKGQYEPPKDETATATGGVVLCADEPTMTRQLNALSNIVHRALLYGGDQELLVLSETLADNRITFTNRWYPNSGPPSDNLEDALRPGLQYLNSLITLLRQSYDDGAVTDLNPLVPLSKSYSNSYERLMASLVEMGSGYVKPEPEEDIMSMPKPRNAQEELGRFAVWETAFRSKGDDLTLYPDDLEGTWEVRDEVSGETIGTSKVVFLPQGDVTVDPPLQGLRWRLDPGPTHLDTCTFQVLSEDGMILQYRGFIDRGARLEARFSKRPSKIRGSVMFQSIRSGGSSSYWKDIMPINYKSGGTKFVMTKKLEGSENSPLWKNV